MTTCPCQVWQFRPNRLQPDIDVLEYWKSAERYLVLRRIARDYLGVAAITTQTERENSKAKYVATDVRNRLSSTCIQATWCLKTESEILLE